MKHIKKLKAGVAPAALGLALAASPALAQQDVPTQLPSTPAAAPAAEEIIVTGSRIASPNLKSVAPVTSINNEDIKTTGLTRIEDLLNQLPQVFAAQSSSLSNGATGTAEVDLRHLGAKRTLVLVNGRRLMSGDPFSSAADLNFIPQTLIKRVDLLTGGASATYGADAVSGVVNFVIDKEFTGFKLDLNDGFYQHGNSNSVVRSAIDTANAQGLPGFNYPNGSVADGNNFDGTLAYGTKFADGAGHLMIYAGYRNVSAITQNRRDYSACTLRSATTCGGSATSGSGNGAYFTEAGGASSTLGMLGAHTLTTGTSSRYNFAPTNYYQRPDERVTAGAFVNFDVSPAFKPYLEFMFMSDHSMAQIAPSGDFGNTMTINCNNPLLSAQQASTLCTNANSVIGYLGNYPVTNAFASNLSAATLATLSPAAPGTAYFQLLKRNVEGGARVDDLNHKDYRAVIGAGGDIGKGWHYDVYYQFGRVAYSEAYFNDVSISRLGNALNVVDVNGTPTCSIGAASGCVPYDVFSGNGISSAALNYISAIGRQEGENTQHIAEASLSGDLGEYGIKSPWSSQGILINIGGAYRHESVSLNPNQEYVTGDLAGQGGATLPISGSYNVYEAIGELNAPLITEGPIYALNLESGIRYSHYSYSNQNSFNTVTWKVGLTFQPVKDITFRGSINRAVRAPNIQEVFAPPHVSLDGSTDPCAGFAIQPTDLGCLAQGLREGQTIQGNPSAQYNGMQGGNPTLRPEVAITKSLGVVLTPHQIRGLTFSVDYYDIKIRNAIQQIGADAILGACNAAPASGICGLINRNPAGSLWLTTSGYVNDVYQNIGGVQTRGFDFNANMTHSIGKLGTLSGNFDGGLLTRYLVDNGVSTSYNCAGYYGVSCGVPLPKWRHKARVSWATPVGITASVTWRYVGPVDVDYKNASSTIGIVGYKNQLGSHIDGQSYIDLAVQGRVNQFLTLRMGINNLFDRDPPLVNSSTTQSQCASIYCNGNTYPGVYDALGRYFHFGATVTF